MAMPVKRSRRWSLVRNTSQPETTAAARWRASGVLNRNCARISAALSITSGESGTRGETALPK